MKTKMILPAVMLTENNTADQVLAQSLSLEDRGADGILLWDGRCSGDSQEETLISLLKTITQQTDIFLTVYQVFPRFEDIKKIIYAGAARVIMNPLEGGRGETLKEGIARFGGENVLGTFLNTPQDKRPDEKQFREIVQMTGCRMWLMDPETMAQYETAIRELALEITLCANSGQKAGDHLANPQIFGITWLELSSACSDAHTPQNFVALKKELKDQGIHVQVFESAVPFSEFKTNSDGLIPVVTQDYKTGKVLMLAYMNEESYNETIRSGRMTYYSRSRQCLWKKGDTSGHYQFVKSLDIDCDKDTILAKVKQIGAACHTGNESCFFTNLVKKDYDDVNPATILQEIMATVSDRKAHPKEGSYTNYLFDKGIDKILKKVGEEATEIVIAAKNPDPEELKYEIADFLYHMIVLMVEKGLTWEEISGELAKRH